MSFKQNYIKGIQVITNILMLLFILFFLIIFFSLLKTFYFNEIIIEFAILTLFSISLIIIPKIVINEVEFRKLSTKEKILAFLILTIILIFIFSIILLAKYIAYDTNLYNEIMTFIEKFIKELKCIEQ